MMVVDELHELTQRPVDGFCSGAEEFTNAMDIFKGRALAKEHFALLGTVGFQGVTEELSKIMLQVIGSTNPEARQQILKASDAIQMGHLTDEMEDIDCINLVVTDDPG